MRAWPALFALLLAACGPAEPPVALGTVEWDDVDLRAPAAEPVLRVIVREGQRVEAGELLLVLDARRTRASLAGADAEIARVSAMLDELRHGARPESIAELRARHAAARTRADEAQRERTRLDDLAGRALASRAALDQATASARAADAEARAARAALDQMLAGTRIETLAQAEAQLAAARATRESLAVMLERLEVRAPRAGRVDTLHVREGDDLVAGAPLLRMTVGIAPHARVYVPEPMRAGLAAGARFDVHVGSAGSHHAGTLRHVADAASFTPYFALTGNDAVRLTYVALIDLDPATAAALPAGLPAVASPQP